LRLERIDIVHYRWIGAPGHGGFDEGIDTMIALQKEGKIRHIGLSNVNAKQLEAAMAKAPIATVQNMDTAGSGGSGPLATMTHAAVDDPAGVLRACEKHGLAYLPFFPLGVGKIEHHRPRLCAIA